MTKRLRLMQALLLPLAAIAQTTELRGEFTYYADPGQTIKEAKAAAIENARIAALGKEFGTLITQDVLSQESTDRDGYFMQLSTAEVKGEWVKDLTPPEAKVVDTSDENIIVIQARVHGIARPLKNEAAEFDVLTLRNGTTRRYQSTDFVEGDKFYLYFKSPADGYVAAYLIDEQRQVLCLLPHENSTNGQQRVEHGKEYVFFSEQHDPEFNYQDGMQVYCSGEHQEINRIYVIFSTKPFVKPVDNATKSLGFDDLLLPRSLALGDFSRWMGKVYGRDKNMSRKVLRISIKKK